MQLQSTPPKRKQHQDSSQKQKNYQFQTPPKPKQNPQSKTVDGIYNSISKLKSIPMSALKRTPQPQKSISPFNIPRIDQDYIIIKTLGKGCFSSVVLCQSKLTGEFVAIKQTKTSSMSVNQVQALGTLSIFAQKCKNIVRYYHSWHQDNTMYIVMEYCQTNITNIYQNYRHINKTIPQKQLRDILKQSLVGLRYMHNNKIVHLDIKPDNLLLKDNLIKIADLGLCRAARITKYSQLEEGDSRYLAKQVLNYQQGVDLTKADIYSLGLTIFEGINCQKLPNNGQKWVEIRQNGLNLSKYRSIYSIELLKIIESMTMPNWKQRPTANQILDLEYMKDKISKRKLNILRKNHKKNKEDYSI